MNSKYILYCVAAAIIIVGIYQIVAIGRVNYPEYNLKEGQVSEVEIIAPFDFPVLKSPQELAEEKEEVLSRVINPTSYRMSHYLLPLVLWIISILYYAQSSRQWMGKKLLPN